MSEMVFLVPRDAADVVKKGFDACDNLGLILDRYVSQDAVNNASEKRGSKDVNLRSEFLRDVCMRFAVNEKKRAWQGVLKAEYQQWLSATRSAPLRFTMRTASRLIVGMGGKGALEVGITLRHISGLPVIPGSALKGAARAYALYRIAAEHFPEEKDMNKLDEALGAGSHNHIEAAARFQQIFGTQTGSTALGGVCVFYDAIVAGTDGLPKDGTLFEADVLTPHFPNYYRSEGGEPPGDNQNPVPVTFLTVAPGVEFVFAIGLRTGVVRSKASEALCEQAASWLEGALQELAIGSKTAAGYGAFVDTRRIG
jgi:CRISPR-associated protein Cmr6